jgi:hypothetical protein
MNFRRLFTAMALLALCVGLASAQVSVGTVGSTSAGPLACTATAANPPQLRSEGITELVGDIVLTCQGGNVLAAGAPIPTANITISLNVNVTSRLISAGSGQPANASEALLLIDEPGSSQPVAYPGQVTGPAQAINQCSNAASGAFPGGPCQQFAALDPVTGQVVASSSSTSATAPFNTFIGLVNANQVTFNGVPVLAPSTVGVARVFRITNVRANAAGLGSGGLAGTTPVIAFISISGTTALPITNPQVQVGFSQMGLTTSVRNANGSGGFSVPTLNQCVSTTKNNVATLRFSEGFASAFKTRVAAPPAATGSSVPTSQNIPGQILNNSESGLVIPGTNYGLADSGTRLKAVFNNIPAGVSLWVSTTNVISSGSPAVFPSTIPPSSVGGQAVTSFAQLVISESTPDSAVSGVPTVTSTDTFGAATVAQIPVVNGSATAVWEVTNTNPNALDNLDFAVYEAYTANTGANSPPPGTATVNMSFAPISTVTTASPTAFIPRFVDNSTANNVFTVAVCQTVLLYPFVTNQGGFDTGIAIANTTTDPFGTKPQAGSCTLNFFGASAPAAAVTTGSIASGTVYTALASTSAAGFQGYMIAVCNFTLAHGFAFISDLGARNLAMGYLAEILPSGTNARIAMPEQLIF